MKRLFLIVPLLLVLSGCAAGSPTVEGSTLYVEKVVLDDGRVITCIYDVARKWGSCDWAGAEPSDAGSES